MEEIFRVTEIGGSFSAIWSKGQSANTSSCDQFPSGGSHAQFRQFRARGRNENPFKTPEESPPREWLVTLVNSTVLPTMPIAVVVVVIPVIPIRVVIIAVTRIVTAVIRFVVAVIRPVGWITKSKSYMHSSLGLIWRQGNQSERDER